MSEKVDEKTGEVIKYVPVSVEKYDANDPIQLYMNPVMFDQLQRFGRLLASSQLVPGHLQGQESNCALIIAQAFRWKMDPLNVAQATYIVSGKLGYEGKLIAAVINASSKLDKTLNYEYKGDGDGRVVRVFGTLKGEDKPREVIGTLKKWKTRNSQWTDNPDQMLSYRGAREWARRHMPEAVLGVQSIDEVEEIAEDEARKVLPEVLDTILSSKDVKATDDPPERGIKVVEVEAEVVEKEKPEPKKKEKKYKVGDVLPNGKIIEELDDKGQPAVVRKPKSAPASEPDPEPGEAIAQEMEPKEKMSKEDEDIDGLFS